MSRPEVEFVDSLLAPLDGDLVRLLADDELIARLRTLSEGRVDPRAEVFFRAAGGGAVLGPLYGFDGIIAGWREWLSTFASYRLEFEDLFHDGHRVISLVRQTGRTIHGGVEVPSSPSAAIFDITDGVLTRAAFYMDRGDAAREEGFQLPGS